MPSLSPGLHYVHEVMSGGRTLGTVRTYVPGGLVESPQAIMVFANAAAYDAAAATPASWAALAAAPPLTDGGSVIGFLGGTFEWGARHYTLDTGPMIDPGDVFHPTLSVVPPVAPATTPTLKPIGIDLNRVANILTTGSYILSAVPQYGEPKSKEEAQALGLDYYISLGANGEYTIQEFLPADLEAAVAAAGGYYALDAAVATGSANALERRAWYLTDPSRSVVVDMCIRGVRFILAKVQDPMGCCSPELVLTERQVRQALATLSIPGMPLDPIGHAGTLPPPETVEGINSDIGIYTYATFTAGAGGAATNPISNNSYETNKVGPDFGTGNGPAALLYWVKSMTFYPSLEDALMRRNGRTLSAPKTLADIEEFQQMLLRDPETSGACNPCSGLGWPAADYITASFYDFTSYCTSTQSETGVRPVPISFVTSELSPSSNIDIAWLGRVNPVYRVETMLTYRASWRPGGSALHMYADPKPLIRFDITVTPGTPAVGTTPATPTTVAIDTASILPVWSTLP